MNISDAWRLIWKSWLLQRLAEKFKIHILSLELQIFFIILRLPNCEGSLHVRIEIKHVGCDIQPRQKFFSGSAHVTNHIITKITEDNLDSYCTYVLAIDHHQTISKINHKLYMNFNVIHTILCVCGLLRFHKYNVFLLPPKPIKHLNWVNTHVCIYHVFLFFYTFNNFQMVALQHISYNTGKERGVFYTNNYLWYRLLRIHKLVIGVDIV